ncbi:hypothetical protein EI94DRAFT_1704057 [Lactarius quietus]|nr:hypothetical protein EI94DRAFT_1704057 [Lactarius quietus]
MTPYPRIHTIIELIGEEWRHKGNGQTDEERELDFSNFSRSHCLEWLNALKNCVEWWKPRTPDFNNEEVDELSGDNPPPMPDGHSAAEEDKPMDEDDGGEKTPWMSHTHKCMIVTSPSEVDAPPARCPWMTNAKDFCGPCQEARATSCLRQPAEKKNATACLACTVKKRPCSPPLKWAQKIGTENIKVESAPITSKSARKQTAIVMLEDIVPSLDRVEWTVLVDGTEFRDRLSNIEACLRSMATTSGVDLLSLNCTPPIPLFNTSSFAVSCASTPTSINPAHISTLSIQESPGAGPSGSSSMASKTQSSLGEGNAMASSSQILSVAGSQASSRMG